MFLNILLNSVPALVPAKLDVALASPLSWVVGYLGGVTLCSSILEQAIDKFYTILERRQIGGRYINLYVLFNTNPMV